MPRVFIAIPTALDLQHKVSDVRTAFQHFRPPLRWVNPSHLHLTLSFLGEIPQMRISAAKQALLQAVETVAPFQLKVHSLGCFPSLARPRILWMGVEDLSQTLIRLYQQLKLALQDNRFDKCARGFQPHLTVARFRKPVPQHSQLYSIISGYDQHQFGHISVEVIHLYESRLQPSGPIYSILCSARLQG